MNTTVIPQNIVFSKNIQGLGDIQIRPFSIKKDSATIYDWVTKPYATYWGMQEHTLDQVKQTYQEIVESPDHDAFIGVLNEQPIFLMERYNPSKDIIAEHYEVKKGDCGMHILVSPAEKRIPNFTWHIFSTIIEFLFHNPKTERIVVEPDVRNEKIHTLNKRAGFQYLKEIELPHKKAALAFCTRKAYEKALVQEANKSANQN